MELPSPQLLLSGSLVLPEVDEAERQLAAVPAEALDGRHRAARLVRGIVPGLKRFG